MLTESYKSTQIEGTQISQDEMYYLKYMEKNDDNLEIQNLKKTIMYAFDRIEKGDKIDIGLVNAMHSIISDQCNNFILKIQKIKEIYREDMKKIEVLKGNSVYRIMPVLMKQIVFTQKEVQELSGVSVNVVSNVINQLVNIGIIIPDSTVMKKGYRYKRIYDVFVSNE